ncbi:MAG: Ig-like domain-containing protein [Alphaproteobacteria bacterium]
MNRTLIIAAAAAVVIAVLIGVLLLSLPDQSETTTAAVQAVPAEVEATDSSSAEPEEPVVAEAPVTPSKAVPDQPQASAEPEPQVQPQAQASAEPTAAPEPAPEPKPAPVVELVPPSFDVVRVETTGEAVLAGRAMVGSEVFVLDGGASLGMVAADGHGQWAFVIATPLTPGSHELSLEARLEDGRVITSIDVVVVNVPQPQIASAPQASPQIPAAGTAATESPSATASASESAQVAASSADAARAAADTGTKISPEITVAQQPLAVLMPRSGQAPSQVLQQSVSPSGGLAVGTLVLETIDYDENGAVIGGRAEPGARLIVYMDDSVLGEAVAGPDGRWSLVLGRPLEIGLHKLRVDSLDEQGKVVARVETPFSRAVLAEVIPDETSVVVQPGNSLWRIARRVYGEGIRYTVIFDANQEQIRNADLIYPGQIFKVPMTTPVAAPGTN